MIQALINLNESTLNVIEIFIQRLMPLVPKDFEKAQIPLILKRLEHNQTSIGDYSDSIQHFIILSITKNNVIKQLLILRKQL